MVINYGIEILRLYKVKTFFSFFRKVSFFMKAPGIDKTDKLLVSVGSGERQH